MRLGPFTLSIAFALTALTGLGGCSSDNYFCDDTGCFYCDGLGCREVDPPDRPTCRGDFECPEGSICTDLGCVEGCDSDGDCPDGTVCRENMCVGPTEPDPDPRPGTCTINADCGDAALVCRDGMCVPDDISCGDSGCSCLDTGMCSDGFTCLDGECRADEDVCQFNFECGAGRQCVDGRCTTECGAGGADCPDGQECDAGYCRDVPPTPGECTRDTDCAGDLICLDSSCVDGCSNDGDCGAGEYCAAGRCRVDTRPTAFCDSNDDCRFICVDGVCRTPCEDSEECARVDVQFSICLSPEAFCGTTNEATSDCTTSVDCPGSEECIDGICR